MRKCVFYIVLLVMIVSINIFTVNFSYADEPADEITYIKYMSNDKYVFVMLGDDSNEEEVRKIIDGKFSKSGLYKIDDTENPLWTISFYEYEQNIFVSNDGIYMARIFSWPQYGKIKYDKTGKMMAYFYDIEAVCLYSEGKISKRFYISDFVNENDNEHIGYSDSHFTWLSNKEFNSLERTLLLKTAADKKYTIDISTGEIIKKYIPANETIRIIRMIIFCLCLIVLIVLIIYLIKIKLNVSKKDEN